MSTQPSSRLTAIDDARVVEQSVEQLGQPAPMIFSPSAFEAMRHNIGTEPAETGGMLGGRRYSSVVEHFYLDHQGATTAATYYPDMTAVNSHLKEVWNPTGINLLGFVHSHPAGSISPSQADLAYSQRILTHIPSMGRMLLPIVQSMADAGSFGIRPWVVERNGSGYRSALAPLEVKSQRILKPLSELDEYARVAEAYDLNVMATSRVVAIGCGGSAQFLEDLARTGVGEFVLIDPDVIEAPNVGTQQVSIRDIGVAKVTALARRIIDVSPHARVLTVQASSDDLTDDMFARLINAPFPGSTYHLPSATLLCAFTDGFEAQARVNRLGLHFKVPVLAATVYWQGRGVELTFACADVTPACIRCALSSRYRQYLKEGYQNTVTSHGTPLWVTARLNSMKTPIALALLHQVSRVNDSAHPAALRAARLLDSCGSRNLVMVSLDSDVTASLGLPLFDRMASPDEGLVTNDLTLWRRPTPDDGKSGSSVCPDCGGTGDYDSLQGTFLDTRPMPLSFGDYRFPAPQPPLQVHVPETSDPTRTLRRRHWYSSFRIGRNNPRRQG